MYLGLNIDWLLAMFIPALKKLGKHALSTSVAVVGDVSRGHDWRESAKRRFSETGEEIVGEVQNKVQSLMTGSGVHHHFHHQSKKRPYSSDYEYAADFLEGRDVAGNEGEPSNKKRKMEAKLKLLSIKPPPGAEGNISNRKRSRSVSVKPSAEGEGCAPSKKRKKSKKSKSKPKSEKKKKPKSKKAKKPKSKKSKKSKSKESKKKNKTKKGKKKSKKSKNLETAIQLGSGLGWL